LRRISPAYSKVIGKDFAPFVYLEKFPILARGTFLFPFHLTRLLSLAPFPRRFPVLEVEE